MATFGTRRRQRGHRDCWCNWVDRRHRLIGRHRLCGYKRNEWSDGLNRANWSARRGRHKWNQRFKRSQWRNWPARNRWHQRFERRDRSYRRHWCDRLELARSLRYWPGIFRRRGGFLSRVSVCCGRWRDLEPGPGKQFSMAIVSRRRSSWRNWSHRVKRRRRRHRAHGRYWTHRTHG